MVALGHSSRILRFLLILIAVALTIFVYASYSTIATTFTPASQHLRDVSAISAFPFQSPQAVKTHMRETNGNVSDTGNSAYITASIGIRAVPNDLMNNHLDQHDESRVKVNRKSIATIGNEGGIFHKKHYHQPQQPTHHREPTIDDDALADNNAIGNGIASDDVPDDIVLQRFANNDLFDEQYVQNVDNNQGNLNNSMLTANIADQMHTELSQQQQQMKIQTQKLPNQLSSGLNNKNHITMGSRNLYEVSDSDVLIPTSNLQKFIENADKMLKNMTVVKSNPSADAGLAANDNILKQKQVNDEAALPPSAVMTIKRVGEQVVMSAAKENKPKVENDVKSAENKLANKVAGVSISTPRPSVDTSHGILASQLYESGHLNEEINIAKICPDMGRDLKLLILITSAPMHAESRLAIRQTWGHYGTRRDVSTAFMLGRTLNESLQLELTKENFIYGDLIRGNFIDSYNNLTLKTISSLEWVDQNCNQAKFILKTDDDMFINVPRLLSFLSTRSAEKHVIYGRLAKNWKPVRNKKSKYSISTQQFAKSLFPPFTTGPAYVLSNDTIHELYVRSLNQVYLKLEDVFTTGIVAQQLGIKRTHVNEFLNRRVAFNPCNIRKTISVHMIRANEQFDLWRKVLDKSTKCK